MRRDDLVHACPPARRQVRRVPSVDAVPSTSANVVAGPTARNRPVGSTKVNTQRGEQVARSRLPARLQGATGRAKETGQRVRLCPKTTKETPLLPMVGLRRIVVSRPTWFTEVRTTTRQPIEQTARTATSNEHAESPKARPRCASRRGAPGSLRLQVDEVRRSRPPARSTTCALSAKATPEAKRGGEAPLRVVGVCGTRSTPSRRRWATPPVKPIIQRSK